MAYMISSPSRWQVQVVDLVVLHKTSDGSAYGSFQESGAFIQTPNSRALIMRTPTKRDPPSL